MYYCGISVSRVGEKITLNPKEHQAFAWAIENEVKSGKYKFYGEHQAQFSRPFRL